MSSYQIHEHKRSEYRSQPGQGPATHEFHYCVCGRYRAGLLEVGDRIEGVQWFATHLERLADTRTETSFLG